MCSIFGTRLLVYVADPIFNGIKVLALFLYFDSSLCNSFECDLIRQSKP